MLDDFFTRIKLVLLRDDLN